MVSFTYLATPVPRASEAAIDAAPSVIVVVATGAIKAADCKATI